MTPANRLPPFLLMSEAARNMRDRMFGGLRHAKPIKEIKTIQPRLRASFGPQLAAAGSRIRRAVIANELPIYAMSQAAKRAMEGGGLSPTRIQSVLSIRVDPRIVELLITTHERIPDQPIAIERMNSLREFASPEFLSRLSSSYLVLFAQEYEKWSDRERRRGIWPSQGPRATIPPKARRRGRPSFNVAIDEVILELVRSAQWDGGQPVEQLVALIDTRRLGGEAPSYDTVRRRIDHLYVETGEAGLRRTRKRGRPKRPPQENPQKS